jgi:hypothetical protein
MTVAQPTMSAGRPVAITVICVLSMIGIVLSIVGLVTAMSVFAAIAAWYPIYIVVVIVVNAASTYGLWMMKKWGLYVYTASFIISQLIAFAYGGFSIIGLVIPLIVLAICWAYQARMT